MAKHVPWYEPRDEDGDDALLDRLGQNDSRYNQDRRGGNGRNGGGCALLIIAGASVASVLGGAAAAVRGMT